jgi:hypothetical protein
MFLKAADKKDTNTGKTYRYYKLCQSYRIGDKTRHRTICVLGKLDELQTDTQRKALADRIEFHLSGSSEIFPVKLDDTIEKLASDYSRQIQRSGFEIKNQYTVSEPITDIPANDFQHVDLSSIELEDVREIGAEWLCKQTLTELGLTDFLSNNQWSEKQVENALIHLISKACFPGSERKTALRINNNSAVSELFGRQPNSINRFDLYKASNNLYSIKTAIETHLSTKTNELFDLKDKIILYDLTNTYFEGRKAGSHMAKFGKSKEKRSDAKIIAIALVINIEGFVKHSKIYRGNISDCQTLKEIVTELSDKTSFADRKPTVVMDAGISTDENLEMLKATGYHYVCVSRTKLKDYEFSDDTLIHLSDQRGSPIEIRWVSKPDEPDRYIHVHSKKKMLKERSMKEHFNSRFEQELQNIAEAIHKKGGTKKYGKVMERIGRIKERYPAANKHYEIEVSETNGKAEQVKWNRKELARQSGEGEYFLRTSHQEQNAMLVWGMYNTIRQVENVFRVFKTDIELRPVFHKNDNHTMAHLFLAVVAYSIINTVQHRLKSKGIKRSWSNIIDIMRTQKAGTITMNQRNGKKVHLRVCSKPNQEVQNIYKAMGYKPMPFHRKKFVFPEI